MLVKILKIATKPLLNLVPIQTRINWLYSCRNMVTDPVKRATLDEQIAALMAHPNAAGYTKPQ